MNDVKTNSQYLQTIERNIKEIQALGKHSSEDREINNNLNSMRKMINYEFKDLNCEKVYITDNNSPSYFFGICVFPTVPELENIATALVSINEKTKIIPPKNFIIEIDSKLMYDLGASPEEITAGLLHEIGHRVYSAEELINLKYRFINTIGMYAGMAGSLAFILKPLKWLLFNIILITFTTTIDHLLHIKDELKADSLAIKYGYGSALYSLLDRITKNTKLFIMNPDTEKENNLVIQWSVKNMLNFSVRKMEIEKYLQQQSKSEKSSYLQSILDYQLDRIRKIKGNKVEKLTPALKESLMNESISTFFELRRRGSSQLELDELRVEIDRIEDNEDRLYVISRIYKDMDLANGFLTKLNTNKMANKSDIDELNAFKADLNKMLEKVRSIKVRKDNDFTIIIKNPPDDYEGRDYIEI